jgi:lactoylglutathione lyase
MRPKIDLITIVTNKLQEMHLFYRDVLGFKVKLELDSYIEFESPGVRFALTTNKVMKDATNHESYSREKQGQSVELAFPVTSPSDVDKTYKDLIKKGAFPVKSAKDMPWGQRAAFIADPDGNIHEIFAELPKSAS